jgi:LPXTG-motif cell wall-anchored protein
MDFLVEGGLIAAGLLVAFLFWRRRKRERERGE